ncbi:hypothetical protein IQ07DRAFT_685158 [Pyrenochaeta sp. DS3sAY3a]|nr:hypothetical protein IQ07DRAFT_685158 [Pyrenochaeta sp. DS3sAY3a]
MRNLYIIGPQCTGKTTLVNALEQTYINNTTSHRREPSERPTIIREVARTVLKEKNFTREDITTSPLRALALQKHILEAQYEAEIAVGTGRDSSSWYISDRSGVDPIAYTYLFVSAEAAQDMLDTEAWSKLETNMKKGIVVLCEAGCKWLTDDGTRLMPADSDGWKEVELAFRHILEIRGIVYSVVLKDLHDLDDRVRFVKELLNTNTDFAN